MGLIGNISVLEKTPGRWRGGGATGQGMQRSSFNHHNAARNAFAGGFDAKTSIPSGYIAGSAFVMAQGDGGMGTSSYTIVGDGDVTDGNLAGGRNAEGPLSGAGDITNAALALVLSAVAALVGSGALSADIFSALAAQALLEGDGDIAAALGAKASLLAGVAGVGDATADATADGSLSAAIIVTGDALSTANVADAILDALNAVENGMTVRQALRLISAAVGGKASGAETTEITFRNAVADTKDRIIATVDSSGNRTVITADLD